MSERISWLDGWRGIVCCLMLVYHLLFDCLLFGWLSWDFMFSWPMELLEKFIAWSFILCAGISAVFSHHNIRRGIVTLLAGLLVIAASFVVHAPILFGVLQFLGLAMILYSLLAKWLEKVPGRIAPVLWLVLFVIAWFWTDSVVVESKWLFWLGFKYVGFTSYDYFPLLPYIFLFLCGSWLGRMIQGQWSDLPVLQKKAPKFFAWTGRHTLLIYLLHQPVLYGLCFVVFLAQSFAT